MGNVNEDDLNWTVHDPALVTGPTSANTQEDMWMFFDTWPALMENDKVAVALNTLR